MLFISIFGDEMRIFVENICTTYSLHMKMSRFQQSLDFHSVTELSCQRKEPSIKFDFANEKFKQSFIIKASQKFYIISHR